MTGALRQLPRIVPAAPDRPAVGGPDHPIRKITRQIALESGGWGDERRAKVRTLFDGLAPEWHTRQTPERGEALRDALARGDVPAGPGPCLELGCGTGAGTAELAARFDELVAVDLSREMLARVPRGVARCVQADASTLPLANGWARVIVLVNMLLFPDEVDRVLAPGGALVWVNSLGECTPIHLPAADVASALPGRWIGLASEAGWGTWCVLRRDRDEPRGGP